VQQLYKGLTLQNLKNDYRSALAIKHLIESMPLRADEEQEASVA
jgi:hypothetical protein